MLKQELACNNSHSGQLLWGVGSFVLLFALNTVKYNKQMKTNFHQLSQYYNILHTYNLLNLINFINLIHDEKEFQFETLSHNIKPKLPLRTRSILEFFLTTNIKLCMKGDQTSMCNLQPQSFQDHILSYALQYIKIYNLIYITFISYK